MAMDGKKNSISSTRFLTDSTTKRNKKEPT
jgi:hypothetical protein